MYAYKIRIKLNIVKKSTALYLNSECEFDQTYLFLVVTVNFNQMNIQKLDLFIPVE